MGNDSIDVMVFDIALVYKDEPDYILEGVRVGVITRGSYEEAGSWLIDTIFDSNIYFYFDDIEDVIEGAEMGDGATIHKIYGSHIETVTPDSVVK